VFSLLSLKKLKEAGIKFYYNILGDGDDEVMIRYLVHELGLSEDVKIHGKVSNLKVQEILENTHVFILPSLYEGVSNAALEAMAMQIPVLTTKAGGMEEVVSHLENGLVINRFDVEDLYKNLYMLVNNKELCMKISLKSRDVIESKFNSKRQIEILTVDDTIVVDLLKNTVMSNLSNKVLFHGEFNILDTYTKQVRYFVNQIQSLSEVLLSSLNHYSFLAESSPRGQ
jgi:hypothetical protein